jgi:DNA modification methylase
MIELINGNSFSIPLADKSIQCVVTSSPYYNLRDYGTAQWLGGDINCDHKVGRFETPVSEKQFSNFGSAGHQARDICPKCGAIRVDKQLGMESLHDCLGWATGEFCHQCYVCHTLVWTEEVWRVLRDDGTFWLNLGDSYNGSGGAGGDYNKGGLREGQPKYKGSNVATLKPKDLCGIPWRVALALQSRGWTLRSDIIWNKTNPMPESAKDRPTKAHEYIFLLTKSSKYYYDNVAIMEEAVWTAKRTDNLKRGFAKKQDIEHPQHHGNNMSGNFITGRTGDGHSGPYDANGKLRAQVVDGVPARNKRTVWTISTLPYKGAHFATFPPALVKPCILAGTKMGDIVLDPFVGSGTTLLVSRLLGRSAIGLDLSYTYLHEQARKRLELDKLKAWTGVV